MSETSTMPWESIEKWTAAAFFVAGIFLVGRELLYYAPDLIGVAGPEWAVDVGSLIGHEAALFGLLGIYSRMKDRGPWLSRVLLGGLALLAVSMFVQVVGSIFGPEEAPGALVVVPAIWTFGSPLLYLLFGTVSVSRSDPSRTVGLFLLVLVGAWVVFLVALITQTGALLAAYYALFGLGTWALGYVFWTESAPTDRKAPASEPTAE